MKRNFLLAAAMILGMTAVAQADGFSQVGIGSGSGSAFSESTSGGISATGSFGDGSAEQSTFSGATNLSSAAMGSQFGGGTIKVTTETLSQGETISKSNGWSNGSAISVGGALGAQNGGSWADGKFKTGFVFAR